jgi:hypothetical protein
MKLCIDVGLVEVHLKQNFTPLSFTVQEIWGHQATKQGSYADKILIAIEHAKELRLLLFKR